jgi:glycosyltransferase involved in cell wall biosynthesis
MKNVLLISYDFPPVGGPTVQRNTFFSKYLPLFGYDPVVITASNKAQKSEQKSFDETLLRHVEARRIIRTGTLEPVRLASLLNKLRLLRLLLYFMFPDLHVLWCVNSTLAALKARKKYDCKAILTSSFPWSTCITGFLVRTIAGIPWIADFRDPWTTDNLTNIFPTVLHYWAATLMEAFLLRRCDHVVVATPQMQRRLLERYPFLAARVSTITNGFDGEPQPFVRSAGEFFTILYTGTFEVPSIMPRAGGMVRYIANYQPNARGKYYPRSPELLFESVARVIKRHPDIKGRLKIRLVGWRSYEYRKLAEQLGIATNVDFVDQVPFELVDKHISEATLLFLVVMFYKDAGRSHVVTGKLFEYLRSGKPVFGILPDGDAKDILERAGVGIICAPDRPDMIDSTLIDLYKRWENGKLEIHPDPSYIQVFTRKNTAMQLSQLLDKAVV